MVIILKTNYNICNIILFSYYIEWPVLASQVNCVLMRGINLDELCDFVEMTRDRAIDYRFIEFMPFSMNDWKEKRMVPYKEAIHEIAKTYPNFGPCDNSPNSTSKVRNEKLKHNNYLNNIFNYQILRARNTTFQLC